MFFYLEFLILRLPDMLSIDSDTVSEFSFTNCSFTSVFFTTCGANDNIKKITVFDSLNPSWMAVLIPAELLEMVCKTYSTILFCFLLLVCTSSISVRSSWCVSAFPLSIALITNNSFDGISSIVSLISFTVILVIFSSYGFQC